HRYLAESEPLARKQMLWDYLFLHRDHPAWYGNQNIRRGHAASGLTLDRAQPGDHPAILEMVARQEGVRSAEIARHWLLRQPEAMLVVRDRSLTPIGFMAAIRFSRVTPEDLTPDPGTQAAWRHAQTADALSPSQDTVFVRFWMARDAYQRPSPVQGLIFAELGWQIHAPPGLAMHLQAFADPDFWDAMVTGL